MLEYFRFEYVNPDSNVPTTKAPRSTAEENESERRRNGRSQFIVVAVLLRALLGDDSLAARSRVSQAVGEGGCGSTSGRAVPLVLTPAALSLIISQP